ILRVDLLDHPPPKAEGLGVWVVDTEDPHAASGPEQCRVAERAPQGGPIVALEVERVDVLVLLRWILRVLDRAVRPMPEPFGVIAHPRMVRRGLPRKIERDLQAEALRLLPKCHEVFHGAELWMYCGVAAR